MIKLLHYCLFSEHTFTSIFIILVICLTVMAQIALIVLKALFYMGLKICSPSVILIKVLYCQILP